jgi:3-deoxy-D-manno-octulosonic-acid transferase
MTFMRLVYTLTLLLSVPFLMLRLWWRGRLLPAYRQRWRERMGFGLPTVCAQKPLIWIHAVSVGEVVVASKLIQRLQRDYPEHSLLVTTTTPTGSERLLQTWGDQVLHCYLPWDLPWAMAHLFRRFNPRAVFLIETEIWPNLVAQANAQSVPIALVNARLSARSARGYGRFGALLTPTLQSLDLIVAQTKADARRFTALGVDSARIATSGNIKFDQHLTPELRAQAAYIREQWGGATRDVWVAASTHEGEEQQILRAYEAIVKQHPKLLLCIVPRHPDRFDRVFQMALAAYPKTVRRSEDSVITDDTPVVVADTMGELVPMLGAADVVFMGGSLVPTGGHNMLEAAQWGVPVVSGPHTFNFAYASRLLIRAQAMLIAGNATELAELMSELLGNEANRWEMGARGQAAVEGERGALERLVQAIKPLLA